jgi:hypothetical protein
MKVLFIIAISILTLSCGNVSTTSDEEANKSGFPDGAKNGSDIEDDNDDITTPGGSLSSYEETMKESAKHYCKMVFSCKEGEDMRSFFENEKECPDILLQLIGSDPEVCINFYSNKAAQCISCTKSLSCAEYFGDYGDSEDDDYEEPCPVCEEVCDWA